MSESIIRLGTSGYSFEDWRGDFYPQNIKKSDMLSYYSKYYKAVEINFTYYSIPHQAVFYHLSEKTPADFEFIVKLNKESTHIREEGFEAFDKIIESCKYLKESGKLYGYLAQFPYSFKNNQKSRRHLVNLKEKSKDTPFFVEFRNIYWVKPEIFDFLNKNEIGYCCVDEPRLKGLISPQSVSTTDLGYVRFHGRNAKNWWHGTVEERYDYLYTKDELSEWLDKIRELRKKTSKSYLFFNNCHLGYAIKNAQMMGELLNKELGINVDYEKK